MFAKSSIVKLGIASRDSGIVLSPCPEIGYHQALGELLDGRHLDGSAHPVLEDLSAFRSKRRGGTREPTGGIILANCSSYCCQNVPQFGIVAIPLRCGPSRRPWLSARLSSRRAGIWLGTLYLTWLRYLDLLKQDCPGAHINQQTDCVFHISRE